MRLVAATCLALLLAGCTTIGLDDEILEGYVENGSLTVSRELDAATREYVVHVAGDVRAHRAQGLEVEVHLDDGSCATQGPQGTPAQPVASLTVPLRDPRGNETIPFEATLRSPLVLGADLFVYALPDADNSIGPIFGLCRNVPP